MPLHPQERINRFEKNFSAYRLIIVVIISCVLMYQDYQRNYLSALRVYLSASLYPAQYLINFPRNFIQKLNTNFSEREQLLKENNLLKKDNFELRSKVQQVYKLESENKRLYDLLGSQPQTDNSYIFADIIAVSPIAEKHHIIINKGSRDNVLVGSAVADSNGILGHIIRDQIFGSEVLLMSDREHAIPIEIVRTSLRTIAVGTGNYNELKINTLPTNTDVKKGDILITSGLGGRYPEGFPVGTVKNVINNPGESFLEVSVTPFGNLKTVNEMWVIQPTEGH
jgi:rod shape-determining protein MreC